MGKGQEKNIKKRQKVKERVVFSFINKYIKYFHNTDENCKSQTLQLSKNNPTKFQINPTDSFIH